MALGGYLVVDKDGNGHLPTERDGKLDHRLMGDAWAALHEGYRGNKYEGPGKTEAIAKLKKLYEREGLESPGEAKAISRAALCAVIPDGKPPESILIMPAGRVPSRDQREAWVNDDPESVIAATEALEMTAGIPIDYDHATDLAAPHGRPAPAAGWIKKLRVVDGAIWGEVEWTEPGAKAVAAGEWRYISPVFDYDKKNRRVTRILRAALTNNPALYETAIASREDDEVDHKEFCEQMASLFGLDKDAKPEEIHAAAKKHVEAASKHAKADAADGDGDNDGDEDAMAARLIASGKVVSQRDYTALASEVNNLKAERRRERAAVKVEEAIRAGKLISAQREWGIAYCAANEKDFDDFIAKQPALSLDEDRRLSGRPPGEKGAAFLTRDEQAISAAFGLKPEEFVKSRDELRLRVAGTMRPEHSGDAR